MAKRKIHLYGALRKYGAVLELDVATPIEAFRALFANFPESKGVVNAGHFKIIVGSRETGKAIDEDGLVFRGSKPIHIIPVAKGRGGGRGGAIKIVAGLAIIALAVVTAGAGAAALAAAPGAGGAAFGAAMGSTAFTVAGVGISYGTIASIGVSMVLSGVMQALSPSPKAQEYSQRESPDQRPSFLYNGPVNTAEQGSALPLVYGKMRTGSVLISAGVSVEQI